MSEADPWSWGVDEGSAAESDQWNNGWGSNSNHQQHQPQQVSQQYWGDSNGENVHPPAGPPKGRPIGHSRLQQQRRYPASNNNIVVPPRPDVENSEIAPPDTVNKFAVPPMQRPVTTKSPPRQSSQAQHPPPPVNAASYFSQRPPEPAQNASQDYQSHQQQSQQVEQQSFFNQFSHPPSGNNNNQDFFHQFLPPTTDWNGVPDNRGNIQEMPPRYFNNQHTGPVDNYNPNNLSQDSFVDHEAHKAQENFSHQQMPPKNPTPIQEYFSTPNDQNLTVLKPAAMHVEQVGNGSQDLSQPPLQNFFTPPDSEKDRVPNRPDMEFPPKDQINNQNVPSQSNFRDESIPRDFRDESIPRDFRDESIPRDFRDESIPHDFRDESIPRDFRDESIPIQVDFSSGDHGANQKIPPKSQSPNIPVHPKEPLRTSPNRQLSAVGQSAPTERDNDHQQFQGFPSREISSLPYPNDQGYYNDERNSRQSSEYFNPGFKQGRLDGEGHADNKPPPKTMRGQSVTATKPLEHAVESHVEHDEANVSYPSRSQETESRKTVGSIRNMPSIDGHEDYRSSVPLMNRESTPSSSSNIEGQSLRLEKSQAEGREGNNGKRLMRGEGQEQSVDMPLLRGSGVSSEPPRGLSSHTDRSNRREVKHHDSVLDNREEIGRRGEGQEMQVQSGLAEEDQDWGSWEAEPESSNRHDRNDYRKRESRKSSPRYQPPAQPPEASSAFRKYEATSREGEGESSPPPARGPAAGHSPSPPRRPTLPDNQEMLPDISSISINQTKNVDGVYPLDRNQYLETSQLSSPTLADSRQTRHFSSTRGSGGEREIEGEAEGGGRVVVGGGRKQPVHSTPVHSSGAPASSPQLQGPPSQPIQSTQPGRPDDRSDLSAVREGGSGDGDDYRPPHRSTSSHHHHRGPPPSQQGNRGSNRSRHLRHRPPSSHRESSYDDDDDEYSSDRGPPRGRRHRPPLSASTSRSVMPSSEYLSDEDYEYDTRRSYHRDRRRDRDYSPEYSRRDTYRDERRRERDYYDRRGYSRHDSDDHENYRPSSRGDSDYRARRHRPPHVDPAATWNQYYNQAVPGYGLVGTARDYEYNQEYYEMLRRTNPVLYAIWYNDYMSKITSQSERSLPTTERAPSVGTGTPPRSTDATRGEESVGASSVDYTPKLFTTAHARGAYDSLGRLVMVDAHDPMDGQPASVALCSVEQAISSGDPAFAQFLESPGPFVPNITHRSTVLQYLKRQADQAQYSSEKLLYDFVHLTLKSNGAANVSDVAELLMESFNHSMDRRKRGRSGSGASGSTSSNLVDDIVPVPLSSGAVDDPVATLDGFRDLLQQGDKSQALEWAMSRNLWGHALLLSSKMDMRTHQAVTGRFAASLPPSDPLQTLYQLMSGIIPQAASSCGDSKWCDWRPHLAMMLSNSGVELVNGLGGSDPKSALADLTSRSILVMADTLASRGRYYAAHFCYLVARAGFGTVDEPGSSLVLLGASPECLQYTNYRAMMLTMCYEYAVRQADPPFSVKSLQRYKALAAWRLAEAGRSRAALQYCEAVAQDARRGYIDADAVTWVAELAQYLEALDRVGDQRPDWLLDLLSICDSLPQDETPPPAQYQKQNLSSFQMAPSSNRFQPPQGTEETVDAPRNSEHEIANTQMQPPLMQPVIPQQLAQPVTLTQPLMQPSSPQHQPTFQPQLPNQISNGYQEALPLAEAEPEGFISADPEPEVVQPTLSKPKNYFDLSENQLQDELGGAARPPQHQQSTSRQPPAPAPTVSSQNDKKGASDSSSGGWFGSLVGKLSLRPKNQMILPDDTEPKIVYDHNSKKWVDKEGGGSSAASEMKLPPKMTSGPTSAASAVASYPLPPGAGGPGSLGPGPVSFGPGPGSLGPGPGSLGPGPGSLGPGPGSLGPGPGPLGPTPGGIPSGGPSSLPPSTMQSANRYKLQKGKSMKSNYVDVLGGSGAAKRVGQLPQNVFNPSLNSGTAEPEASAGYQEMGNMSRSSSMSSLSREVESYTGGNSYRRQLPRSSGNLYSKPPLAPSFHLAR